MMSLLPLIGYLLGAIVACWIMLEAVNVRARWRWPAALAVALLWPGLVAMIALFLAIDVGEWLCRLLRRSDDRL